MSELNSSSEPRSLSRRRLLQAGAAGATAVGVTALGASPAHSSALSSSQPRRAGVRDPFQLGVASGDPLADGVVLWTRLAPDPIALDGRGGMPDRAVPVQWQVAEDESFRRVVARGTELAEPEHAHSVHVEVSGLRPRADYFYRFRAGGEISPVGRTRTAPSPGARTEQFAFAFASCQHYPSGYYNAYANMVSDDLDLVIFLGDYIYEGGGQGELGRGHAPATEIRSLADYRVRLAQYKSDPELRAAHASFPWAMVFDDHEVENNWADDQSQNDGERDADPRVFLARRARALQAYYEHMPLRRAQRPHGPNLRLYRRLTFGDLMDFYLLDTRQYRSDQVGDARHGDQGRTMLGDRQQAWLRGAVAGDTARWNVLAQQVFFSQRDFVAGPGTNFSNDGWDGYRVERNSLRDHLAAAGTSNPVVLTGDVHASYVSDVKADFDDPDSATVATELVGTSISSGGNGQDHDDQDPVELAENPHIKFVNHHRGYVRNTITRGEWTADYRVVERVTEPGVAARTRASFSIENGRPGAERKSDLS